VASFSDKVTVVIDVVTEKATRGMKDFKSSVKEAEGFTGKLKAGVGALGSQFKAVATSPAGLATGVAALGAGALKAVDEFASLGIEVGKFSDATGVAADDASRLMEVAGDVGIDVGSLESAIGKLNKTIDPELFADLGIEIAKTADGATDVNGTFLNVIDKLNGIKDPAEKARVASKLLGKGWQEMAELIGQGSDKLSKSLEEVSDAKVIDKDEVEKARRYRAAMDELNDAVQDMVLSVGAGLTPAVVGLSDALKPAASLLGWVADKAGELKEATSDDDGNSFFGNLGEQVKWFYTNIKEGRAPWEAFGDQTEKNATANDKFTTAANKGRGALNEWNPAAKLAKDNADALAESTRKLEDATKDYTTAYSDLLGKLDEQEAWEGVIEKVFAAADGVDDTAQEFRDATREVAEYIDEFANIPPSVKTSLIAKLDKGAVAEVTAYLNGLRNGVTVPVKPVGSALSTLGGGGNRAAGGQVRAGMAYEWNEQGREMFVPNTNGVVVPHGALAAGGGGGAGMVVNIYPRTMPTERELIDLVNGIRRKQGQVI
jgi:uncharacterized phage infection (PIP) family protein YhgE